MSKVLLLLPIAWRNLWRNSRRSLLVTVSIAVGVWSMLFMGGLMNGWSVNTVDQAIDNLTGHGQVRAPGYLDDPGIDRTLPPPSGEALAILERSRVSAWATRVEVPGVVRSERETGPVTVVGITPQDEVGLSFIAGAVVEGRTLEDADDAGLLIGRKLAERLRTGLGKRVVVMARSVDRGSVEKGYRIVGIYAGATEGVETAYVFVGQRRLQSNLGLGERITGVSFRVVDEGALEPVVAELRDALPEADVRPWNELLPLTAALIDFSDGIIYLWMVVMFVVLAFGIVNTLLMAVMERKREIGLLQALGMRPRLIVLQVFLESVLLVGLGVAAGFVLGQLTLASMSDGIDLSRFSAARDFWGGGSVLVPTLSTRMAVEMAIFVWVMGVVSSLYPAWKAASEVPLEAISTD